MTGPGAARYPAAVATEHEPVEAYLPIAEPVALNTEPSEESGRARVVVTTIPAATCAVATHVGGYDTVGDTYRQLGAWVARNARSADLPVREIYVVSVDPRTGQLLPPDQLRTEICWPIDPASVDRASDTSPFASRPTTESP